MKKLFIVVVVMLTSQSLFAATMDCSYKIESRDSISDSVQIQISDLGTTLTDPASGLSVELTADFGRIYDEIDWSLPSGLSGSLSDRGGIIFLNPQAGDYPLVNLSCK